MVSDDGLKMLPPPQNPNIFLSAPRLCFLSSLLRAVEPENCPTFITSPPCDRLEEAHVEQSLDSPCTHHLCSESAPTPPRPPGNDVLLRRDQHSAQRITGKGAEARPTWRGDAAAQRRQQREQQQRPSKAGPLLCHQVYSPDRHAVTPRSRQLISDVQEVEDLPSRGQKL